MLLMVYLLSHLGKVNKKIINDVNSTYTSKNNTVGGRY